MVIKINIFFNFKHSTRTLTLQQCCDGERKNRKIIKIIDFKYVAFVIPSNFIARPVTSESRWRLALAEIGFEDIMSIYDIDESIYILVLNIRFFFL